jgi:hypothetical protein
MPVGIEGLGKGLLQGYQFGLQQKRLAKQDERQAAQDERQIVQDAALAKSQDIANRTNEFQLQNGQQTAARADQDRLKSQTLNQAIHNSVMAVNNGDYDAAGKQLVDVNNNPIYGNTFKMNYLGHRDTGKKDEAGKPIIEFNMESTDASGKVHNAWVTQQDITVQTMHQLDPIANYQKQEAERAAAKTKKTDRKNALADAITLDDRKSANDLKLQEAKDAADLNRISIQYGFKSTAMTNNGRALLQKQEEIDDGYGGTKVITTLDNDKVQSFLSYAEANKLKGNDADVQHWIALGMPKSGNSEAIANPKEVAALDAGIAFLKGRKIKSNSELAGAMKELKAKGWTKDQINTMLDKAGL